MLQKFVAQRGVRKNSWIWFKRNASARAATCAFLNNMQRLSQFATRKSYFVQARLFGDFNFRPLAQRIHALHTHAVQAARNFIRAAVKLSACVNLRQNHFHRGAAIDCGILMFHRVHGHAAAVIANSATTVHAQQHGDVACVARHGFINGVIHALVHQMVQAFQARASHIHARSLANSVKPLKHLNGIGVVGTVRGVCCRWCLVLFGHTWHDEKGFHLHIKRDMDGAKNFACNVGFFVMFHSTLNATSRWKNRQFFLSCGDVFYSKNLEKNLRIFTKNRPRNAFFFANILPKISNPLPRTQVCCVKSVAFIYFRPIESKQFL